MQTQNRKLPMLVATAIAAAILACNPICAWGQEHPFGQALPEHPQSSVKPTVSLDDVAKSIQSYVTEHSTNRVFVFHDAKTGKDLSLTLEKVHRDKLSAVGPDLYFACADFKGADGHTYDLDFFTQGTNQVLKVIEKETSVHKVDGKPRYNWHYNKDSGLWEKQSVSPGPSGASTRQPTAATMAGKNLFAGGQWQRGETLFEENCAKCHGANLRGGMMAPSLVDITKRMSDEGIVAHARKIGATMCCAQNILNLSDAQFGDIIAFLHADDSDSAVKGQVAKLGNGGMCGCTR